MIESMAIIETLKEVNLNYIEINKVWQFQLELKRMKTYMHFKIKIKTRPSFTWWCVHRMLSFL
jgi:hypothetical protein